MFSQAQPEDQANEELTEINTQLQDQLRQEKNDMQMKSEELNILIRFCISADRPHQESKPTS